jgi:hypothetical protein
MLGPFDSQLVDQSNTENGKTGVTHALNRGTTNWIINVLMKSFIDK